jgi:hypothetical protein
MAVYGAVGHPRVSRSCCLRGGFFLCIKPGNGAGEEPHPLLTSILRLLTPHLLRTTTTLLLIMKFLASIHFVLGAALYAAAQTADAQQAAELVADLKNAPTQVARLNILKNNRDVRTIILRSMLWYLSLTIGHSD